MIQLDSPILVLGAGSIGERHMGILLQMGYTNLRVFRQRNLPLRTLAEGQVRPVYSLDEVDQLRPKAAIVCTPTVQHLEQVRYLVSKGIDVLVEKPLSHSPDGIEALISEVQTQGVYVQVGYMLRYHPFFQEVKEMIRDQPYGALLSVHSYWGEYLPNWHPWEDYRQSYAALRSLGGGVALTLSHDLDLTLWLVGDELDAYTQLPNYRSSLDLDVEAGADFLLRFREGTTAHCHLNFYEKTTRRYYRFVFEEASIEVDYLQQEMTVLRPYVAPLRKKLSNFERNQLFEAQWHDFVSGANGPQRAEKTEENLRSTQRVQLICQNDSSAQ